MKQFVDIEQVRKDLLKAVRGHRSQTQINRKLGYRANQVYRWESGRTRILWRDFVRLTKITKRNLPEVLKKHIGFTQAPSNVGALIRTISGFSHPSQVAGILGESTYTVRGWMNEKRDPPLDAILCLIDQVMGILCEFAFEFGSLEDFPSLAPEFTRRSKVKMIVYRSPWLAAVLECLNLQKYLESEKHDDDLIAQMIGIDADTVKRAVRELEQVGMIAKEQGKYRVLREHVDLRGSERGTRKIRRYWARRFQRLMSTDARLARSLSGQFVYPVSSECQMKLRELHYEFLNQVLNLVKQDTAPKERIISHLYISMDLEEVAQALGDRKPGRFPRD